LLLVLALVFVIGCDGEEPAPESDGPEIRGPAGGIMQPRLGMLSVGSGHLWTDGQYAYTRDGAVDVR